MQDRKKKRVEDTVAQKKERDEAYAKELEKRLQHRYIQLFLVGPFFPAILSLITVCVGNIVVATTPTKCGYPIAGA